MTDPRYEEYRKRKRREDTVMLAKRLFVLQMGHGANLRGAEYDEQPEVYRRAARNTLIAAEAFMTESEKVLAEGDPK